MATGTPADRVHRALPPLRRRYAETTHHAARSSNASPCITSRQGLAATNTSGTLTSARAHPGSRHRCMKSTWTNHNASQWTRSPSLHEAPPFLGAQAYARARLANGHDATSMMTLLQGDQALLQASTLLLDAPARNSVPESGRTPRARAHSRPWARGSYSLHSGRKPDRDQGTTKTPQDLGCAPACNDAPGAEPPNIDRGIQSVIYLNSYFGLMRRDAILSAVVSHKWSPSDGMPSAVYCAAWQPTHGCSLAPRFLPPAA